MSRSSTSMSDCKKRFANTKSEIFITSIEPRGAIRLDGIVPLESLANESEHIEKFEEHVVLEPTALSKKVDIG
jgi:hypothetical protein